MAAEATALSKAYDLTVWIAARVAPCSGCLKAYRLEAYTTVSPSEVKANLVE